MQNRLLRSRVPVIFCLRAKLLNVQRGKGRDAEIVSMGLVPICEKNFIFEMTFSALIGPDHRPLFDATEDLRCAPLVPAIKAPEEAANAIRRGLPIGVETGQAIAEWRDGGEALDDELEDLKRVARDVATMGMDPLERHWRTLSKPQQAKLKPYMEDIKLTAMQADQEANDASRQDDDGDTGGMVDDPLDDPFTPGREAA